MSVPQIPQASMAIIISEDWTRSNRISRNATSSGFRKTAARKGVSADEDVVI
jgi:hypothetical protein